MSNPHHGSNPGTFPPGELRQFTREFLGTKAAGFTPVSGTVDLGNSSADLLITKNRPQVSGGDGIDKVVGFKTNHDAITLGNGPDRVGILGNHNSVVLGNGSEVLWEFGNGNSGQVGNGNRDIVRVAGSHSNIAIGNGNGDLLTATRFFTIGSGTGDRVVSFGSDDTFVLSGGNATMLFAAGKDNMVFVNGGVTRILDTGGGDLTVNIGAAGGTVGIKDFPPGGVIDLAPNLGFATSGAAFNAVTSDGHGGSLLTFADHLGSIDLTGVAPGQLHASNFHIG